MPLQRGQWQLDMNGTQGTLTINGVDTQGLVTGVLRSGKHAADDNPIIGRWDEARKRLVFHAVSSGVAPPNPSTEMFTTAFTGYLFRDEMRMPGLAGDVVYTLVGNYLAFSDAGTTDRHEFGWYAQIGLA